MMLPLFFVLACGNSADSEKIDLEALEGEVFAIHDEVMPLMGKVRKLENDLEQILNTENIAAKELDEEKVKTMAKNQLFLVLILILFQMEEIMTDV